MHSKMQPALPAGCSCASVSSAVLVDGQTPLSCVEQLLHLSPEHDQPSKSRPSSQLPCWISTASSDDTSTPCSPQQYPCGRSRIRMPAQPSGATAHTAAQPWRAASNAPLGSGKLLGYCSSHHHSHTCSRCDIRGGCRGLPCASLRCKASCSSVHERQDLPQVHTHAQRCLLLHA